MCRMCEQIAARGGQVPGEDEEPGTVGLTISSGVFDIDALDALLFGSSAEPVPDCPATPLPAPPRPREPVNLHSALAEMGYFEKD